jgi:prepilin-type N-terminal cleavage/methylation domain-containing protein
MPGELKKMRIINKHCKAFTLTEVVVASLLLGVATVPILKALTNANLSSIVIEQKTRSLTLAQAKLDEIKARSIYHYTNSGNPTGFEESGTSLDGLYLCNVTDDLDDLLKTITVSVGYNLNGDSFLTSDEIQVTLTTLLARRWTD